MVTETQRKGFLYRIPEYELIPFVLLFRVEL